jgi:3-isopropylmalate dehydrogenase
LAGIPKEGKRVFGLYEPIHGSAPDIAGRNVANPLAAILSAALMLRFSLGLETEARRIEEIVTQVLAEGYRTADIVSDGTTKLGTKEMGNLIAERITGNSL